jgi:hypothetical protein
VGKQHTRWSTSRHPFVMLVVLEYKLLMQTLKLNNSNTKTWSKWIVLCCVVDYATLTWKQGCSGLKCWCKVFIVHTLNHIHILTSQKTLQAWCIAEELYLK